MNRDPILIAMTLTLALATGCVDGGTIALETEGEGIPISGHVLLGGEHEHEAAQEGEEHEEEGEPIADLPIALVVGTDGIAATIATGADGDFAFEVPAGEYHLGFMLPANLDELGLPATNFLVHVEAIEEPVGVEVVITPEPDEGVWHIHGHIFDDEDGDGEPGEDEVILEELDVEVPLGSRQDLILNPEEDEPAGEEPHGHTHSHG